MIRILGTLLMAALASPAWAWTERDVDARRPAAPDARIEIEDVAGAVRVVGWDRDEVYVTGALSRRAEGLDLSGPPHRIRIELDVHGSPHGVQSDLEVRVPAGSHVEIEGFDVEITVTGVKGSVQANTVNGSIHVSGAAGEVQLETVNGDVEVSGPSRWVRAESVNGGVTVEGARGEVEALTVNGELLVRGVKLSRGQLETVSGSIEFEGDLEARATLDLESVSGNVELLLPGAVSADFSISSFSGDIENELSSARPVDVSRYTTEKGLRFSTGSGSARVNIDTLSGSVWLRRR